MNEKKSDQQVLKFNFFKLSENFTEKWSTKPFLLSKDNISQSVDTFIYS